MTEWRGFRRINLRPPSTDCHVGNQGRYLSNLVQRRRSSVNARASAPGGAQRTFRLTENAIRTTFRLDGAIAVDTHNSKFVSAA